MASHIYQELAKSFDNNPRQLMAYSSAGSVAVIAGPGSGKTRLLTVKAAQLLNEELDPHQSVACITFSNECRIELRKRFQELGIDHERQLTVATVHGFCLRHVVLPFAEPCDLKLPYPLKVASSVEQESAGLEALKSVISGDERWTTWERQVEGYRKLRGAVHPGLDDRVPALADRYVAVLRERGLIDFDDITNIAADLICGHERVAELMLAKHPIIVVDEYQDLGLALHQIIVRLHEAGARIFAVGDPDQCIYQELQSARPELLHELSQRPQFTRVELDINYRSGAALVRASTAVLRSRRDYRAHKAAPGQLMVHPVAVPGAAWAVKRAAHARYVARELVPNLLRDGDGSVSPGDIGILVLDKNMASELSTEFNGQGRPYVRISQGMPYERTSLITFLSQAIEWCNVPEEIAAEQLGRLQREWDSVDRTAADNATLDAEWGDVLQFLRAQHGIDLPIREWLEAFNESVWSPLDLDSKFVARETKSFDDLKSACKPDALHGEATTSTFCIRRGPPTHLTIVTLHSAKGLEFPIVIMPMCDDGVFPNFNLSAATPQYAEARRLFYVGVTRAEHSLHFTYSAGSGASPFVQEVRRSFEQHAAP